ncbi:MAG: type III-B CRISPR module RAMP protein Cmr1 [Planctomycetota bacterium]|jgi:CRISPR type III-B/RAMP module RAMP protein Cmr1|nr:type III-B CRISPR module RAMP protein Cmr1 [Planctomycetota bacterium]
MKKTFKITFITPCFCRGADCSDKGAPEIRPASIRGQLRWWFRALGGTPDEERDVFGGIHEKEPKASKVIVRVRMDAKPGDFTCPTLPHKRDRDAKKMSFRPGTSFALLLSTRLGGLDQGREAAFNRAVKAWLLLGALGLRGTRGGGNFRWDGQPENPEKFKEEAGAVVKGSRLRYALLDRKASSAEDLRKVVADTLAEGAFKECGKPLGGINPRKTSPLRFRIVQFAGDDFRIVGVWDGREDVTGNTADHLRLAIDSLANGGKEIGKLLWKSELGRQSG